MTDTPIVSVKDLSVHFKSSPEDVAAVRNVSFDIHKGETLALVGESGSGKSVTAMSILQLLPYPTAYHPSGSITFGGEELVNAPEDKLLPLRGDRISVVFQEPMTSLNPLHTIGQQIGEVLTVHHQMNETGARERTVELLEQVGLPDPRGRLASFPHQLSGGQRQRVMIAMALANEPDLLIADEPTTALDVTVQAQILKLMKELQDKFHMAILMITHDLGIVRKTADRVCVMTDGEIVETGNTENIFSAPQHDYTKKLLAAEPRGEPLQPEPDAREIITGKDIRVWFPVKRGVLQRTKDYIKAVDGVDIRVMEGHTVGVVGESGSGKTTLAMGLVRLEHSQGQIDYMGASIQGHTRKMMRPLRREMQVVFQDPFSSLNPRFSISQIIEEGLIIHGLEPSAEARRNIVSKVLAEVELDPQMQDRYPHEFSGGQRQRIAIARALVLEPKLIVLDEPTSALDVSVQAQIVDLLRRLQDSHKLAYIFISHDLKVVRALADEVIVMKAGKVMEHGPAAQIFKDPRDPYTRTLISAAFDLETDDAPDARR